VQLRDPSRHLESLIIEEHPVDEFEKIRGMDAVPMAVPDMELVPDVCRDPPGHRKAFV
jgi:hypothetical protein